jgi:uncharacterized protein (TIGR02246 family)
MESLEARLRVLEDIEAIRRLKITYCDRCDDNYDPDGLAALFTDDGVWDGGPHGTARGRDEIRALWAAMREAATFAVHYITNHAVDVDPSGETATGTCTLWEPLTMNGEALWAGVRYHERYRKVDGRWLFAEMKLDNLFSTPYAKGWEVERFVQS